MCAFNCALAKERGENTHLLDVLRLRRPAQHFRDKGLDFFGGRVVFELS